MGIKTAVFLVLAAAVLVRFYKVADLGYFMMDEERDMFLVKRIVQDYKPLLIGVSIPGWFYLAPGYYYLSAIVHFLFKLNPIGGLIAASILGVILVGLQYFVGSKLFGKRVGLIAGCLSSFSYLFVVYNRIWWPLVFGPIVSLIVYWSIFDLKKNFSFKRLVILTLAMILGLQSDSGTLAMIPVIIFSWRRFRFPVKDKRIGLAVLMIFLSHITLLIFDLKHDFLNAKAFLNIFVNTDVNYGINFFSGIRASIGQLGSTFWRILFISGPLDIVRQISPYLTWVITREIPIWKSVLGFGLLGIFVIKNRESLPSLHLISALLGISLYAIFYRGYIHEWFLEPLFPAMIFGWAWLIDKFVKPKLLLTVCMTIWSLAQIILLINTTNSAGLGKKLAVVQAAQKEIAGRPYELRSEGEGALRYGGWRYLFTLYGEEPVKSYMDYVYVDWLYPKSEFKPQLILTVINSVDKAPHFVLEEFQGLSLLRE